MKPAIEVRNVSKSYIISHQNKPGYNTLKDDIGNILRTPFSKSKKFDQEEFWALKNISFEINKGEIFGIIGRNGSGKSTLLKILSRIVDPSEGSVILRGRTASLLEVGTGFHPELTGRENVYLNGSMLGMSRQQIKARFDQIVEFSEIEKFIDTPVKFYSSGMYVRLAFAVAAHLEPDILILDEVLSVGDAGFQEKSLRKITNIMEEGRTVIFVSHSMGSVQQLCTNGILLDNGHVSFLGDADELTARYMDIIRKETPEEVVHTSWKTSKKDLPANDYFDLHAIHLVDNSGKPVEKSVKSSQDAWVEFDLTIKNPTKDLLLGYAVYTKSRTLLYFSYFADIPSANNIRLSKGKMALQGKIPRHLLNEGDYRVAIVASVHNKFWIYEPSNPNNPSVHLSIRGGLSHEEYWASARDGLLAPEIEWRQA